MFTELKKSRKCRALLWELEDLVKECKYANYDGRHISIMKEETINNYLQKWKHILLEAYASINQLNSYKKRQEYILSLKKRSKRMREVLEEKLNNTLYVSDNTEFRANTVEELPEIIKKVENIFDAEVNKSRTFFGEAFTQNSIKHGPPTAFNVNYPKTVDELLALRDYTWNSCTIIRGYPQPQFIDRYRKELQWFIEKWLKENEDTIIR